MPIVAVALTAPYFSDEEDRTRVEAAAERIPEGEWQLAAEAERLGGAIYKDDAGDWRTRLFEGACVFQNRVDHPWRTRLRTPSDGRGRAHLASGRQARGVLAGASASGGSRDRNRPPLHHGAEWSRKDWGDGGPEFGWWCTDSPEAFNGTRPAYLELSEELTAICGETVYDAIRELLDERRAAGRASVHPVMIGMPTRKR